MVAAQRFSRILLAAITFLPNPLDALKHCGVSQVQGHGVRNMTQMLTVAEFKERYRISHSAFYREVAANRLLIKKIGRATRIALADAEAWAASLPTQGGETSDV